MAPNGRNIASTESRQRKVRRLKLVTVIGPCLVVFFGYVHEPVVRETGQACKTTQIESAKFPGKFEKLDFPF